jgi:hypothetical protein
MQGFEAVCYFLHCYLQEIMQKIFTHKQNVTLPTQRQSLLLNK